MHVEQFRPYSYSTYKFKLDEKSKVKFSNAITVDNNIRDIPITIFEEEEALTKIRETFIKCVEQRMHSDREMMFMCSGGLDSSLCAGIGAKFAQHHNQKIKTMSIGLEGGTDEKYAENIYSVNTLSLGHLFRFACNIIKSKEPGSVMALSSYIKKNKIKIANLIKEIDLKLSEIFLVLKILFKKI
jgi:hypothetical protein